MACKLICLFCCKLYGTKKKHTISFLGFCTLFKESNVLMCYFTEIFFNALDLVKKYCFFYSSLLNIFYVYNFYLLVAKNLVNSHKNILFLLKKMALARCYCSLSYNLSYCFFFSYLFK